MSRWKHWNRALLALSSTVTLLVLGVITASATGAGQGALRDTGQRTAKLVAASGPVKAGAAGGSVTGPGIGPAQITIGSTWTLDGKLIVHGTVTVTCGPFTTVVTNGSGGVLVEEPVNDKVAHASGQTQEIVCDGGGHGNAVTTLVQDVPFRASDGAAQVDISACGVDPASFQFVCQSGHALAKVKIQ
ncbi:MAG TPA: hypothetical protein VIC57_04325 [Candidatus Dormibacteraeota bacterium]|jgi:hypothetical protein